MPWSVPIVRKPTAKSITYLISSPDACYGFLCLVTCASPPQRRINRELRRKVLQFEVLTLLQAGFLVLSGGYLGKQMCRQSNK